MSLVLSIHWWDGFGWYAGERVVLTVTLGIVTFTILSVTVESLLD